MAKAIGYGSVLQMASSTGTLTIGQVRSITGPGTDYNDVDTTTLDSSTNFRTFVPGLSDPGELTFELVYDQDDTVHKKIAEDHKNRQARNWTITPNSTGSDTDVFSGYVKGIGRTIPLDDLITGDITVKVSGDPGYTT